MIQLPSMKRLLIAKCAFLVCLLATSVGSANGRFPSAQLLLVDPSDPNRLWLRATYGLLTSADRGCTWHRICESAPDYTGTEDPMFGVMADGTVIGGTFHGITTTRDHGCNWSDGASTDGKFFVDLSVQPTDPARAIAIDGSGRTDGGGFTNQLWRTTDSARSWTQLGADLDPNLIMLTLDAAPSAPSRIYVTAIRTTVADGGAPLREGVLLRSENDGASWTVHVIPGSDAGFEPWLSAIHPTDPKKLYVRLRGPNTAPSNNIENRVVYSSDGGDTWQRIFDVRADGLGFALSPDGSRVLLGVGDSYDLDKARPVDASVLGLYAASASDHQFKRTRPGQIGCLTWAPEGLYFCATQFPIDGGASGFELGLSTDEGVTAKRVMRLNGVEGMLECPQSSSLSQRCDEEEWKTVCLDIGRCSFDDGGLIPYPPGETCPAVGGSGGSGGTSADAGAGTGGASGTGNAGGAPPDASAGSANLADNGLTVRGGCGCRTADRNPGFGAALLLAIAALVSARRRTSSRTPGPRSTASFRPK